MTEEGLAPLPPKVTERQRKFLQIWGEKYHFSFSQSVLAKAYVEAGYSPNSAKSGVSLMLHSANLNKFLRTIMEEKNITIERLVEKHAELLDAKHPFAPNQPDNFVQFKAWQEGVKIYGGYPIPVQKVDVHHSEEYHISVEDQRKANECLAECIDMEPIEDGNDDPREDVLQPDRPLY